MFTRKSIFIVIIFTIILAYTAEASMFTTSLSVTENVSGIVYASPGVSVAGVNVYAISSEGYGFALTNLNGRYNITEGLKSGNYTVHAEKDGYINAQVENIQVTAPYETSGVNIYLNSSGGISGRIVDYSNFMGIPNIQVAAVLSSGNASYFGTALTNINGNYGITMNLGSGDYNVSVITPKGYIGTTIGPITVTAGFMTTGHDINLTRSGIISGWITTPEGQPLSDVTVSATSIGAGTYFGRDQTNATGYYEITSGLGTGQYHVSVLSGSSFNQTATPVTVNAPLETSNVNLQLSVTPPPPSGTITGRVTDTSNNPIGGAHVTAAGLAGFGETNTDQNGNYIISSDLGNGTYIVVAQAAGYIDQNLTNVNVTENQVTPNINFQLSKIPSDQSGKISGTVTGDENPIPEFQYPILVMLILTLAAVIIARKSASGTRQPKKDPKSLCR